MTFDNYVDKLADSLKKVEYKKIEIFYKYLVEIIKQSGTFIICGNGGSFANSMHIAGDFQKTFCNYGASFHAIGENFCSTSAVARLLRHTMWF